jgi:hypothetical protein
MHAPLTGDAKKDYFARRNVVEAAAVLLRVRTPLIKAAASEPVVPSPANRAAMDLLNSINAGRYKP